MLVSFVLACLNVKFANQMHTIYQRVMIEANQRANQCESNAGLMIASFQLAKKPKSSRFISSSNVSGRYLAYTFSVTVVEACPNK